MKLLLALLAIATVEAVKFRLQSNLDGRCLEEDGKTVVQKPCDLKKSKQEMEFAPDAPKKLAFNKKECVRLDGKLASCKKSPIVKQLGDWNAKVIQIGQKCLTSRPEKKTPEFTLCEKPYSVSQLWTVINEELGSKHVFDEDLFISYNLELSNADIMTLVAKPEAEEYVPCKFTTDYGTEFAKTIAGAGCRYKGSVGSLRMCIDPVTKRENGDCRKLSVKVDVNKFDPTADAQVNGLSKYIFNGMPVDYSLMSERLIYSLFKEADVKAPRATHVKMYVNGKFNGVYTLVENIDSHFTKREFDKDDYQGEGGLYKDAWLNDLTDFAYIQKHQESSKDESAFLLSVVQALQTTPVEKVAATNFFRQYFDVEALIDVVAMNTVVGATDDWRIRHNFFWYVKRNTDKDTGVTTKVLVMLPWDFDRINDGKAETRLSGTPWYESISAYSKEGQSCTAPLVNPTSMAMEAAQGDMAKFEHFKAIWNLLPPDMSRVIQCDKITKLMSVALKEAIQARTIQLVEKDASLATIKAKLAKYGGMITNAQLASGDKPKTVAEWNNDIQKLYDYLTKIQKMAEDQAAKSGITKLNYKNYLWGGVPDDDQYEHEDAPEDHITKPGAAGQSITDKSAIGSSTFSGFPSSLSSFPSSQTSSVSSITAPSFTTSMPASTQWGVPAPRTQMIGGVSSFSSNLGGSFAGGVSFRG